MEESYFAWLVSTFSAVVGELDSQDREEGAF